ncbi:Valine--tRNA ligase [Trichinella spiralis]
MWVVVDRFNQSNVDENRVRYKHANGGFPTSDKIHLKISGQNPDIASETLIDVQFARKAIKVFSATPRHSLRNYKGLGLWIFGQSFRTIRWKKVTALGITTTPSRFSIVYIPENERGMLVNRT